MALRHKSVHSEEDHKGLGCHLGQGHLVHLNREACVYLHPLLSATATFKIPVNNQCIVPLGCTSQYGREDLLLLQCHRNFKQVHLFVYKRFQKHRSGAQ